MSPTDALVELMLLPMEATPPSDGKHLPMKMFPSKELQVALYGIPPFFLRKIATNASRPSEHPPSRGKSCQNVLGGNIGCRQDKTS